MKILKELLFSLLILSLLVGIACNPKDENKTQFDNINDWIYQEMDLWYFWTAELPGKPGTNVNPEAFFDQLLSDKDRFSFIYDDYQKLVDLFNGVSLESGFEYKLYLKEESDKDIIMQLTYIKNESPASDHGLRRGDVINKINGIQLDTLNYQDLLAATNETYEATYSRYNFNAEAFEDRGTLTINPVEYSENPLLLDTVYEISGKKIGYLVYTFFSPGPTEDSDVYDIQLENVFGDFQSAGINEFILDLRFNTGGSETSIKTLTSLLSRNAAAGDLIFKKTYNDQIQDFLLNDPRYGKDFLNVSFQNKTSNIGQLLNSGRLHVITSNRSASASEVTINSLKSYMDVYIVGDTTVGKDAGSITINEEDNALNNWAIQPIVVKLVNRNGEDYPLGFIPDIPIMDDFLVLRPLGDIDEPLLSASLGAIGVQNARQIPANEIINKKPVFESIEKTPWRNRILMKDLIKIN